MKINEVFINDFGKLKDFSLSFGNGFNLIYGENEQGKSTIMAFIRMMLYGTVNRTSDLAKNLRKKYSPWDGSKMSGSMEFTHEGQDYRLEKTFGATPTTDIVKLWNTTTNSLELLSQQKEIGRRFLGMGEEAFEKSVFIGQIGSVINSDKDKDHEIIQKLQNLVSSGDETKSYNDIETRINTAIEKLKAKRGKNGILDRLQQCASDLEESRIEAIDVEERKAQMQKEFQEILLKREIAGSSLSEKTTELVELKNLQIFKDLGKIIDKDKTLCDLKSEAEEADKPMTNGDFKVDLNFLNEARKQLNALTEKQAIIRSKEDEIAEKIMNMGKFDGINPDNLSKEAFDVITELNKNIRNETDIERIKLMDLQAEEFALKTAISSEDNFNKNLSKITEYREQITRIKSEMEKITPVADNDTEINDEQKRERMKKSGIVLYPWIISLIVFIAAGIFIHPLSYIGALLSIAIPILIWTVRSRTAKRQLETFELKSDGEYESKKNDLNSNLVFTEKQLGEIIDTQDNLIKENSNLRSSGEINDICNDIQKAIELIRQSISDMKLQIQDEFTKYNVDSFEDLQQKYFELQNEYARKNELAKEIEAKQNLLLELRKNFDIEKAVFFEFFSKIKNFVSLQDSVENLDVLTRQFHETRQVNAIVQEKERELLVALNNRSIEEIRLEYEAFKNKYDMVDKNSNNNENSKNNENNENNEPYNFSAEKIKSIETEIDEVKNEINLFDVSLARMKSEMTHAFLDKPELAAIEDEIRKNKQMMEAYQMQYDALVITKTQMEKAFLEMQQSFGPKVNDKTAAIFSEITDGKYNDLLISRDLNISFRDPLINTTQDWQYLSGGTIDQIYFSLRLAISEFMADQAGGLPLFIDDAFLQYDDIRTARSLSFLIDYSKTRESQIIFFTCHQNILKMMENFDCQNRTIL